MTLFAFSMAWWIGIAALAGGAAWLTAGIWHRVLSIGDDQEDE